ncbi:polysaccharide biosynthesis protein [Leptospira selangorensis]|uniref:Polysaccharide biosynthesis protein n=1 Tax=Leptospira selangorensis TaxID=2484982 RepID=A0A5F2C2S4_9LEPT|nr:nucleoside-diphosphate sugar epimerase/dehydratase [Leptospira selangorensis]TGM13493.1 polysaccharide biosynthesis protein [Leptospira selangorensis]TGM22166.1 polysaccharide biosynthesis protein [Leptospira selangorensis]
MGQWNRRSLLFPLDLSFMILSYFLAYLIRFESTVFLQEPNDFFIPLLIVVVCRSLVFLFSNIYRSIWAYASIHDLVEIIKTTILSSLISNTALLFYNGFEHLSRMIPVIDTLLLLGFLCIRSLSWRLVRDQYILRKKQGDGIPTLILGAGKTGATLLTELRRHNDLNLLPLGLLDDDESKIGAHIQGVPVLGKIDQAESLIRSLEIKKVLIAFSNPDGKQIGKLIKSFESENVDFKILPSLGSLFFDPPKVQQLREIRVEDVLGRPVVDLEIESIRSYIAGKTVLITGAGGSIGSELCRQVAVFNPAKMILLDSAETPLYEIDYELRKVFKDSGIQFRAVIADIKNPLRIGSVFETDRPQVVFHSAAYKHVPMMEINPSEAVLNNVLGTKNLADISRIYGTERFVLISTDKAVNPVNIMGASKRVAELYLQAISQGTKTKFITVRFGNVLGSSGSVIPRFREQISNGGPVTVTHPDIIRYFMTIPEATQLVLQAAAMGEKEEIFLLDMGEPIRILNLAEDMIRLSGFRPYTDIPIVFTGLRPGEKLFEELLLDLEGIKKTHHPKIRIAAPLEEGDPSSFQARFNSLLEAAKSDREEEIFSSFKTLVPEYKMHKEYISEESSRKLKNDG